MSLTSYPWHTEEWALNIQQQTEAHGAAFFFKQWGTWGSDGIKRNKHANGKCLTVKWCSKCQSKCKMIDTVFSK